MYQFQRGSKYHCSHLIYPQNRTECFSIYQTYKEPDIVDPAWKESLCLTYGIEQVVFGNDTMTPT